MIHSKYNFPRRLRVSLRHPWVHVLFRSPVFAGGRRRWWSGSFPNYCRNPRGAVQASLRGEMDAVGAYQAAATAIHDPKIQAVLRRIAMDEEHHVKLLREALQRPCCRR